MANLTDLNLGGQVGGNNKLEDLATLFLAQNQPKPQETGPRMIMAGGQALGRDVSRPGWGQNLRQGLSGIAQNYLMQQQMQKQRQFMKSINDIMGSNDGGDVTEKKKNLLNLFYQNPDMVRDMKFDDVMDKLVKDIGSEVKARPGTPGFAINTDVGVPEGMEITGYDQKGQPMFRKVSVNVAEEKLKISQEEKKAAQEKQTDFIRSSTQDTLNTINEIEKNMGFFGAMGEYLPKKLTPGTPFYNWKTNLDKLLSSKMIDLMVKMKEASKTGATGFGQLSEKEGEILRNASTSIKPGLSKEDAQRYLNDMKGALEKVLQKAPSAGYMQSMDRGQSAVQPSGIPQPGQMFNGQKIKSIKIIGGKR